MAKGIAVQQRGCAASRVRNCEAGRLRLLVACCAVSATPWLGVGAASLGIPVDFGLPVTKGGALYLNFSRDGQQRLLEVFVCLCVSVVVCVCVCVCVCVFCVCMCFVFSYIFEFSVSPPCLPCFVSAGGL